MSPVTNRPTIPSGDFYHDIFASSDFFRIDHTGGVLNIDLTYSAGANPPDLDLYLYRESHDLSEPSDIVATSDNTRAMEIPGPGFESFSANISPGVYLLHVSAATTISFAGSTATYSLSSGGQFLCNSPL